MRRWGPTAIVVVLLSGTAIAFATTERQKLEKSPFSVVHVDGVFSPRHGPAAVSLSFRRPHLLTLQILDKNDRVIATLAEERRVEAGTTIFRWSGKDVPDGFYRPKATLDTGREFTLENPIRLDSVAPTVRVLSYRPHVLRRRSKPRIRISYDLSEAAHVRVYVNGHQKLEGGATKVLFQLYWYARRVNGRRLRPGRYRLQLAAVDLAGNIGPRTHVFVVRVR
jgi:hypothetical protein